MQCVLEGSEIIRGDLVRILQIGARDSARGKASAFESQEEQVLAGEKVREQFPAHQLIPIPPEGERQLRTLLETTGSWGTCFQTMVAYTTNDVTWR